MADLSGAKISEFQEEAPQLATDAQADIVKHDPNTFAALTAQNALKTMYAQGLAPTGDDIKGIYGKALDAANEFHRGLAEKQQEANLELQKRQAALPILAAEKTTESAVQEAAQQREEQFRQGPEAVATAKAQGNTGLVSKLGDPDLQRLDNLSSSYDTVSSLHGYFNNMIQKAPGAGGVLRSGVVGLLTQPGMTSPETRAFNSYMESSLVPLGKGVFGDAAVAATKENIQSQMKDMLPNASDNDASGGQKIFMLKQRIMQNLQTMRDDRANAGFDTTPIDRQIARFNSDFMSSNTQKYNILAPQNQTVQTGTSDQANATINSVNAGANAGINMPNQMTPTGYVSGPGTAVGGPGVLTPRSQPSPIDFTTSAALGGT